MAKKKLKKFYKSKSIWHGIIAIVTAFGLYATGDQSLSELLLGASGVLAVALRVVTSEPLDIK